MSNLLARFRIGSAEVAALSDGAPKRTLAAFFHEVDPAAWTAAVGIASPDDAVDFNFGSFLIRADGRLVLIDTGYGPLMAEQYIPGGGELLARMAELDVAPGDIDVVVHTHLHHDHIGWNIDAAGRPTFPNATFYVDTRELEYWLGPEQPEVAHAPWNEERALRMLLSERLHARMDPLVAAGRVEATTGEFAVTGSVSMVPTPGHTPGHCSVLVASSGAHLIIAGDVADHPVHFEHHDWIPRGDVNHADSRRSRERLARLAVEREALVTGGHFPILSLGRLDVGDEGYRWRPLPAEEVAKLTI